MNELDKQKFANFLNLQREEIRKHRWIESEKAGFDLGRVVERDWIDKYAAGFRKWAIKQGIIEE